MTRSQYRKLAMAENAGVREEREGLGKALPSERKGLGKGLPQKRKTLTKTLLPIGKVWRHPAPLCRRS